jgi:hypothetical protein
MGMIIQEAVRYNALKDRLVSLHDDLDAETLADTLEGLSDLNEIIATALRSALDDEAMTDALKGRIEVMKARLDRLRDRARAKRQVCAKAMHDTGLRKVTAEDLTVSLRPGSARLQVNDETLIPADFWRTPEPILDRRGLGEALKGGTFVQGAELIEGEPTISVRVK